MDITHDNVCSSMLSCFYSHLLSTGRPISSYFFFFLRGGGRVINCCTVQSIYVLKVLYTFVFINLDMYNKKTLAKIEDLM